MRYREDTPAVQRQAREEVAAWRMANLHGTAEQMIGAIGCRFDKDYGPFLRAALFAVDRNRAHEITGTATGMEADR